MPVYSQASSQAEKSFEKLLPTSFWWGLKSGIFKALLFLKEEFVFAEPVALSRDPFFGAESRTGYSLLPQRIWS